MHMIAQETMIYSHKTSSKCLILAFLILLSGEANVVYGRVFFTAQSSLELYGILTCEEYDSENHAPNGVTDYFEVSDPRVTLWVNMTKTDNANITVLWLSSDHELILRETEATTIESSATWQEIVSILLFEDVEAPSQGVWSVNLLVDGTMLANYTFNLIDKASEAWGLHAEITGLESPKNIQNDTNFTVSMTVQYKFKNMTVITPGLWSPDEELLIVEIYDEVNGEGTKTYDFTVQSPSEPGDYTIDAAVFYLYDDEWFIDEGGLASFQITVEKDGGWFTIGNVFIAMTITLTAVLVLYIRTRR